MTRFVLLPENTGEVRHARFWQNGWHQPGWQQAGPIFPPLIKNRFDAGQNVSDEELQAAFAEDQQERLKLDEVGRQLDQAAPPLTEFLERFLNARVDAEIAVHVTRYGGGGSYHPPGNSPYQPLHPDIPVSITVLDSCAAKRAGKYANNFLSNVVHETIHLALERTVIRDRRLSHEEKEALVDKVCTATELRAVTGSDAYCIQDWYKNNLPNNWRALLQWKPGQEPTWPDESPGPGRSVP